MLQDGLLRQPARGLHLVEVLLALVGSWTGLDAAVRLVPCGLDFLGDLAAGAPRLHWTTGSLSSLWIFPGALLGPASAGLLWVLVRVARRNLATRRKALATAMVVATVLAAEPSSLLAGAALIPPTHHGPGREPPSWTTAGSLRIMNIVPETHAYVQLTDLFGLIRFHAVAVSGGGCRLVSVRTPRGWLPVRWLVMWE